MPVSRDVHQRCMEREASGKVRGSLLFGGSPRKMEERTDNSEQQRPEFPRRHRERPQGISPRTRCGKRSRHPWRQKRHPSFIPKRRKALPSAFPGQAYRSASGNSAAERSRSEKARQIRDAVSSSHRSEPQTPPSRSGQPRNNESREIPQRRQQPRRAGGCASAPPCSAPAL